MKIKAGARSCAATKLKLPKQLALRIGNEFKRGATVGGGKVKAKHTQAARCS